jgi:O-acetyl-ADP-ribose deacetylase (regulator of RNase III)
MPPPPTHEQLVADLRTLRERGLTRLRSTRLGALDAATALYRHGTPAPGVPPDPYRPAAVEELLRRAIVELGGGNLTAAAQYTFGLVEGTRDWTVGERRRKAASIYGVSTERFRKRHEQLIVDQTAEAILRLCMPTSEPRPPDRPAGVPRSPAVVRLGPVTLDFMPVEMIRGIDVVVSSENVYLEASKIFRNSLSAALRRACAQISETGQLLDDIVQRELQEWMRAHGRPGLPVAAGTVAATDPGRLAEAGVRRVYHAAVAVPRPGGDEYDFSPEAVAQAVRNVFRLAGRERERFRPPLRSIALPLFGAGRGGLDPAESVGWLSAAVGREVAGDPSWDVHLITRSAAGAEAVIRHFRER